MQEISTDFIEMLRGIVLLLDPEGRVVFCNPYFEELTGYGSDDVVGQDWFDTFIPEDERNTIREFFSIVMREGLNDGYTNAIVTKSGSKRLIEWHSKTLEDENRIYGLLCTGYDVTEREAHAQALAVSKQEAEQATMTKLRFLAAASHDLRQPLQAINMYLSTLMRQLDQPEQITIGQKILKSLDTMGELLDALLDISRLESGSITPQKQDFPIRELLNKIITDNIQQAKEKGLTLIYEANECIVHSDPALLERVIENFVTNAIRYTEQGGITISCQCSDRAARIAVSDTGIGIPEEMQEKVFDEYFQLNNPMRDRRRGLGLGLAIVKHIAEILGHPLDASSEEGRGSTFVIEVELGERESINAAQSMSVEPHRTDVLTAIVLFIDDDPAVVDATSMLLETTGVEVHSALNGDNALDIVAAGVRPDVIVSDYRLPRYNGIEVVRRVREATSSDLPAILMTGDTSISEIESSGLEKCTVLRKPVDTDRLIELIAQVTT